MYLCLHKYVFHKYSVFHNRVQWLRNAYIKIQTAEFANTNKSDTTEYKQQALTTSIPFMHTSQHDKYANSVQIPTKSYIADLYSLMIWLHEYIPSVQNHSCHCIMHTRPTKKKPKPWRTGSISQMHHFDKFSADNTAYLARPEGQEYKGSSSLNKSYKSSIATLKTRKRFVRKNIYFLST
jgi:hypothetical protein